MVNPHRVARYIGLGLIAVATAVFMAIGTRSVQAASGVSGVVKSPLNGTISEVVQVCFFGPNSGGCTSSDTTGKFSISLNAGDYRMQATPTYASMYAPSVEGSIPVYADQTSTGVVLNLTTLQMKGRLMKPDASGTRGRVNVHSADFSLFAGANANEQGYYKLGGLSAGSYVAEAVPDFNSSGLTSPAPATVTIGSAVVEQNFTFTAATKTITGVVRRADGSGVDANIDAFRQNGGGFSNVHTTDGTFTLSVSSGSWMVQPHAGPGANWIYTQPPVQVDFNTDATVETKTVNFTVEAASAMVTGRVVDANGAPLTSGNIDVRTQDGRGSNGQIQADGTFTVRVTPGTYNVFLWTMSNAYSLPPTTVNVGENQTVTLSLVAQAKQARITGSVRTTAGAPAPNVDVNAFQMTGANGGQGSFSSTRSKADGTFELAVTAGRWNVHLGFGPDASFVPAAQRPLEVDLPTDTSVVTPTEYAELNFLVVAADATITGRVMNEATNQPMTQFSGCVFARPLGSFGETCGPVQNGVFTLRVSSAAATTFEIGVHAPPNSEYSSGKPVTVTVAANSTTNQDITVVKNNSVITGKIVDSTGFDRDRCDFRGNVFADGVTGHYAADVQPDCSYQISLVAGTYQLGAFFDPSSGALNQPPSGEPVLVLSGQTVTKNIPLTLGDATISGRLLDPSGNGVRGFINVDNSRETRGSRELERPEGRKDGADLGFAKKMPCGASDRDGVIKCCLDAKNKSQCQAFTIPDGPNGCKNAYDCVQICKSSPQSCKDEGDQGPQAGQDFVGPGGCKSETECQTYCSKPENFNTCSQFKPPSGAQSIRLSTFQSTATEPTKPPSGDQGPGGPGGPGGPKGPAGFDNAIRSGTETSANGAFSLKVLSGHVYQVCAGLPPEVNAMPPKCVEVDLTKSKSATVTLQLRSSDSTIEGKVTLNGLPVDRCFVRGWAEDGGFSGTPCNPGGQYKLNVTGRTTWHVSADSFDGTDHYNSNEAVIVLESDKKVKQDIQLRKSKFIVPKPVTTSFDCTTQMSVTLDDGTSVNLPAGAISGNSGTCTFSATPTVDLQAMSTAQPLGVGYRFEAMNESGQPVTKLQQQATIIFTIGDEQLEDSGITDISQIKPSFYDSTTGSYQSLDSCTQSENQISCTTDHFSAYALTNTSGGSAKSSLASVTVANGKFTVNKKTVKPFSCKGDLIVKTKSVSGTQHVVAASSCDGTVKDYSAKGKLLKQLKTGYAGIASVSFADVTLNGQPDVIVSPASGKQEVVVYDIGKKYKTYRIGVGNGRTKTIAAAISAEVSGTSNIATAVAGAGGKLTDFKVYTLKKSAFTQSTGFNTSTLSESNGTIVYTPLKPTVTKVAPSTVTSSTTSKTISLTLTGENFMRDSTVLVCGSAGTQVTYKSSIKLVVKVDASDLTKGTCTFRVTNPDGGASTSKKLLTVK